MPKSKPNSINNRHNTKEEQQLREQAELSMTPKTDLSIEPPSSLKGHKVAAETWKWTVGLYLEIEGKVATSFDRDLLIKYCLLEEEVVELATMRATMKKDWEDQVKAARKFKPNHKDVKEYIKMWEIVNGLFQRFQGIDARLDGKRKLLYSLSQSLYLTPRSRAGVAPPVKEKAPEKSETEKALE